MDLLTVLGDIEFAQSLLEKNEEQIKEEIEVEHPLDVNYKKLNNNIQPLDKNSDEFKTIET